MSQFTPFIPSGPTFIANVQYGQQFNANLVADAPVSYVTIANYGGDGSTTNAAWCLVTADTSPQTVGFSGTADPAWLAQNNGTLVSVGADALIAIANGTGAKRAVELQFVANIDPTSTSTYTLIGVQPVTLP